ncbi:MAG TPA: sulfite exporter TauE/SafE family protein [Desulfobacterales bacterium]|nr:sulfite exporter TauE/SafE family protein [Desulfobacterales bacterium]HIP38440.1 sulfite exporter TauE/SafE family protein [Desulfocapsa sulfexigens]
MMKNKRLSISLMVISIWLLAWQGSCFAETTISAAKYKAGDTVTIKGQIEPGQELYIAIAQQKQFKSSDTGGKFEKKKLPKKGKKAGFSNDTSIPPLYYMITTNREAFGKDVDKKFGGPSFVFKKGQGLYNTTMFKLKKKYDDVGAKDMMGPIKTAEQWNMFKWGHENKYGINTIVKEGNKKGKVVIFARSVIGDSSTGNYWDKGTSVKLDKATGQFEASFASFRHTAPDTDFDVYVNGVKSGSYKIEGNGFWLAKGYRYMNPIIIVIGAILVGTYFSMIGAAGGMLMGAFQALFVQTAGPVGINAANVLRPSNIALTLFSPLGSFYRFAVVEKRVAWPVGLSFGAGIFLGSVWLGGYVTQYLSMKAYKEWLGVLVVIMGVKTIMEMTPAAMNKRKNIKAMTQKFNAAVKKAKETGGAVEMGSIEPVKSGLTDYRFKFWGEEFRINPLLFCFLGIIVGVASRAFGIGGGFLLVPMMTTIAALPMYVAVPISLIGTCFSSIGSFIGYVINGYLPDMVLAGSIIIGGFAGGMLGSRCQKMFSEKTLKIILACTLFFLFFRFLKIEYWI